MFNTNLREFSEKHISENFESISGVHENKLFFDCAFNKLNGVVLKDCDLMNSRFLTTRIKDALGLTLTLDCHSFKDVQFSEELFDMMLALLTISKGNDEKRKKLVEVIGPLKYYKLKRLLRAIE